MEMNALRFSLVLPVYNVEPYLATCLESVRAQSFANWEAVCVDDGSTDGSARVLDDFAARDSRFRVIRQPNAGVSEARNCGIDRARGDYVVFVDPDDWLPADILARMDERLRSWRSDVLISDCTLVGNLVETRYSLAAADLPEIDENLRDEMLRFLVYMRDEHLLEVAGPWCKAYRREILKDRRFQAGLKMSEDRVFNFGVYADRSCRLSYLHAAGYSYRVREGSAVKSSAEDWLERNLRPILALEPLAAERYPELIGRETWRIVREAFERILARTDGLAAFRGRCRAFCRRVVQSDVRRLLRQVWGEEGFEREDRMILKCLRRGVTFPWRRRALRHGIRLVLSRNLVLEFLRYVVVGGVAFLADFGALVGSQELFLERFPWGVYAATVVGFLVGLAVNYFLSLVFVFTAAKDRGKGRSVGAFLVFGVIGLIGLGLTELGMFVGIGLFGWNYMIVKILVTGAVLAWNYLGRKLIIFR